jgi:hypothetical protein
MNPADCLFQCCPLTSNMAWFARHQVVPENIAHVFSLADLDQVASEVRPADESSVGQRFRMLVSMLDSSPGKSASYLLGTPLAEFHDTGQPLLEMIVLRINPETHKMDSLAIPGHREFNSRHQFERLKLCRSLQRIGDTCGRIMVSQSENLDPGRGRKTHEFCGCQGTVGGCRMCVKIINEAHKAYFN